MFTEPEPRAGGQPGSGRSWIGAAIRRFRRQPNRAAERTRACYRSTTKVRTPTMTAGLSPLAAKTPRTGSAAHTAFLRLRDYLGSQIIGQTTLVERLLIALLADGHLLVEGPPGLAKTRAVKALAQALDADFQRLQFTPDLLPADLTGSDIYRPEEGVFRFQRGPLFHNLILADEVNRAPAKVQSALLEAMAEGQISVGAATYPLPQLFLVMATQNPIEQEGTDPLPEA